MKIKPVNDADQDKLKAEYAKKKPADLINELIQKDDELAFLKTELADIRSRFYQTSNNLMIAENKLKYQGGKIITLEISKREIIDEDICENCDHEVDGHCENTAIQVFSESVYAYNMSSTDNGCLLTYTTTDYSDEWIDDGDLLSVAINGELVFEVRPHDMPVQKSCLPGSNLIH